MASTIESDTDKSMAVVADVHTDVNTGQVLEEGVGNPYHLFVLVPVEGKMIAVPGRGFRLLRVQMAHVRPAHGRGMAGKAEG